MRTLSRAARWVGAAAAIPLLALGVQSAWVHVGRWITPPPPPIAEQIDTLVHVAAQRGLALDYQSTARLRPGGELSYIFVFDPPQPEMAVRPSSELRIYDLV